MATIYPSTQTRRRSPSGLRTVPLALAMPYLLFTLLLFFIGPYEWPVRAWWVVYAYVPAAFALLAIGFQFASERPGRKATPAPVNFYYITGGLSILLLLVPTTVIYTDSFPWEITEALNDQRGAYASLANQLAETAGSRGPLALVRAAFAPFAFSVLPLAVIYWTRLKVRYRVLAVLVMLANIDLSILRGTTRELADLMIVGASAYLVVLGRESLKERVSLAGALRKRWKMLVIGPILILAVVMILVGRTEARLGGTNVTCVGERSGACITASEPYNSLPDSAYFGLATVTGYFSQGYYGLALSGEQEFDSTLGMGHAPAVASLYVMLGGDPALLERAYTARNGALGWDDEAQWSTLLAWIANDVGLAGALIFIFLLGIAWGRAWMNATQGLDDRSAVFFCALMMMVIYLPANNQMMNTFDSYATLLFWGFASMFAARSQA